MKLYFRADCPFCWKVRLALHAYDIPYQGIETQLGEQHQDVARLSQTRTVPMAVEGDLVMTDSAVIMEYLNDAAVGGALLPGDAAHQASMREIQSYSDKILGKPLFSVAREKRSKPRREWDEVKIEEEAAAWRLNLDYLEERVSTGSFLSNGNPTLVDCALLPRFAIAEIYGLPIDERHSTLHQWYGGWRNQKALMSSWPTRKLVRDS